MRIEFEEEIGLKSSIKYFSSSFSLFDKKILNIDREGRILSVIFENGTPNKITYKRALNGDWLGIRRKSFQADRKRFNLSLDSIKALYTDIYKFRDELIQVFEDYDYSIEFEEFDPSRFDNNDQIISFWINILKNINFGREKTERKDYDSIYSKVGILPPDMYGSLVLQVTIGCVYNRCSFCNFYREIKYSESLPGDFKDHVTNIKKFLKGSLGRFHSIFLGDANALIVDYNHLLKIFDIILNEFSFANSIDSNSSLYKEKPTFSGIYSFLDVFTGYKITLNHLKTLKEKNLKMVYLGVETGSNSVLKLLNKPNSNKKIIKLVHDLHLAGIRVAIILLMGVGGKEMSNNHLKDSISLINDLNLKPNDIIYLSKLQVDEKSDYKIIESDLGITSLSESELEAQADEFKSGIKKLFTNGKSLPKIAKYEIREFLY